MLQSFSNAFKALVSRVNANGRHKYLSEIIWGSSEKIILFVSAFAAMLVVARHLGPERLGLLGYLQGLVGLLIPLATLGIDRVVVKQLVEAPDKRDEILASSFFLRLGTAVLSFGLLAGILLFSQEIQGAYLVVALLGGSTLLMTPAYLAEQEFIANTERRLVARTQLSITVILAITKVVAALLEAPLEFFFGFLMLEGLFRSSLLIIVHRRTYAFVNFSKSTFRRMLAIINESWLLFLSGIAVALYMKIDQVMLVEISGKAAGGIYIPAVRIVEMIAVFPALVSQIFLPPIIRSMKSGGLSPYSRSRRLLFAFLITGFFTALAMIFIGSPLVSFLFGDKFIESAIVLATLAWALVAIFAGTIIHSILFAAEKRGCVFFGAASGAIINVILNLIFIPAYGPLGAATATVISQFMSVLCTVMISSKTRWLIGFKPPLAL